jgi:hypothetical protein
MGNVTFTFDGHFNYAHPQQFSRHDIQLMKEEPVGTVLGFLYGLTLKNERNGGLGARMDGAGVTLPHVKDVFIDLGGGEGIHVTSEQMRAHVETALADMSPHDTLPLDTQSPTSKTNYINGGPFRWLDRDSLGVLQGHFPAIFKPEPLTAPRTTFYMDPPPIVTTALHDSMMGGSFAHARSPWQAEAAPAGIVHVVDVEQRPEDYDGVIHIGPAG